jgi:hypothetical protein
MCFETHAQLSVLYITSTSTAQSTGAIAAVCDFVRAAVDMALYKIGKSCPCTVAVNVCAKKDAKPVGMAFSVLQTVLVVTGSV